MTDFFIEKKQAALTRDLLSKSNITMKTILSVILSKIFRQSRA